MNYPPFNPPIAFRKVQNWAERKVPDGYSDGDQRHWPGMPTYRPSPNEFYLCVLAQRWAETDGIAQPGVQYYLDKLPAGYGTFETDQQSGDTRQVYKRLFGHPSGKFYDSAAKFEPHFMWLMSGMEGECECSLCKKKSSKPIPARHLGLPRDMAGVPRPGIRTATRNLSEDNGGNGSSRDSSAGGGLASKRTQRQVRQAGVPYATDEEGTEDIYRDSIRKLENARGATSGIEIDLAEDGSIDWKADRQSLPQYFTQIEQQHSFIPRIGELVLWCSNFLDGHYLMLDTTNSEYKFYSFEQKCFHGFPAWRGGVVAATPSATVKNGSVDFPDILDIPTKMTAFNTAGFRIESMPDPNDDMDKSLSKQYSYVPLRNIRPLTHWQLLLKGIQQDKIHPSVQHALTCMTSLSLLEKHRFNGDWPHAHIFCKGAYIGSELITVGDTVRLMPSSLHSSPQPDILVVSDIRYHLLDITPDHTKQDSAQLCARSFITLVGRAYTTDLNALKAFQALSGTETSLPLPLTHAEIKSIFRPVGMDGYGAWYPWHGPRQKYEVSHERILGRLYEADAVGLWTGQRQISGQHGRTKTSIVFDKASVLAGRQYATATDGRLPEPSSQSDINWHLADTRAESLAIATLNGVDVGRYHGIRTPSTLKQWRMQVKIADGQQIAPELEAQYLHDLSEIQLQTGARRGRPPGSKVIDGKLVLAKRQDARDSDDDDTNRRAAKPSSQMAGAALATNDEDSSADGYGDSEVSESHTEEEDESEIQLLNEFQQDRPARANLSKADIMNSIEVPDDETFDDDVSEKEEWWSGPLPPARGGTEESEGGDYRE